MFLGLVIGFAVGAIVGWFAKRHFGTAAALAKAATDEADKLSKHPGS